MGACPLFEAGKDLFDTLLVNRISLYPSSALEDEGVAVLEHGKYYGPTENCYP